jgi:uncharacterized protein (UPF0297 family)
MSMPVTDVPDKTMTFDIGSEREREVFNDMQSVYKSLVERGYNPINQLVGYILSEDPTFITVHNGARNLIRHITRDELLSILVKSYLKK